MPTIEIKAPGCTSYGIKFITAVPVSVKKPPPPTKSKERQNHHEETWFRKIVYYAVKYEESMIVTYCSRKPALCQAQYMHLTRMCLHSQQAK